MRAGLPDLRFHLLELGGQRFNLFRNSFRLRVSVLFAKQSRLRLRLRIELLLKRAFALKQCRITALSDIRICFRKSFKQGASTSTLADLQRRAVETSRRALLVQAHQQVNIEPVVILDRGEVGGTQLLIGVSAA